MTNINYNNLAMDIYEFCCDHEMWDGVVIYFDGKALASWNEWGGEYGTKIGKSLYLYTDKQAGDYLEYINPDGLSCAFDGSFGLHTLVNDWGATFPSTYDAFSNIFKKYGLYYELGHSYYLTTAEL